MFSLICVWINGWVNNREAGDLRRHGAHYDVMVMSVLIIMHGHTCTSYVFHHILERDAIRKTNNTRFVLCSIEYNISSKKKKVRITKPIYSYKYQMWQSWVSNCMQFPIFWNEMVLFWGQNIAIRTITVVHLYAPYMNISRHRSMGASKQVIQMRYKSAYYRIGIGWPRLRDLCIYALFRFILYIRCHTGVKVTYESAWL